MVVPDEASGKTPSSDSVLCSGLRSNPDQLRASGCCELVDTIRGHKLEPVLFITACLLIASSSEPEIGYQHRVHCLLFNLTLGHIDNNDGITIIDISNTKSIKYCFAFLGS